MQNLADMTVMAQTDREQAKASELAVLLGVRANDDQARIRLLVRDEGLALQVEKQKPVAPDFRWTLLNKKRQEGRQQGIVRACRPAEGVTIVDLTAGWGKDAATLASFGARVIMIERHPVMQLLLEDALARRDAISCARLDLHLVSTDALQWLTSLSSEEYPEVIYMDPMHPLRDKKALVKKEMQLLQRIIGPDNDAEELLTMARSRVKKRLVLKWPKRAQPIGDPSLSIMGNTVRFDCFFDKL